jgi:hypothetical protein
MLESDLEKKLRAEVKARGGECYKFTSPGRRRVPDRMCVFPGNVIVFVEVKRPKKEPTDEQWRELRALHDKGVAAYWINCERHLKLLCERFPPRLDE